jgi:hypothetical protein
MSDQVVTSIPGIQWFKNKINDVKQFGTVHGISYVQISIINSFFLIFLISLKAMTLIFSGLHGISDTVDLPHFVWDVAAYFHIPLWIGMTLLFLPIVSKGMILVEKYSSKIIFHLINRLDLILWRKYGCESPVSARIWNVERKMRKLSLKSKRQILMLSLCLYGVFALHKLALI